MSGLAKIDDFPSTYSQPAVEDIKGWLRNYARTRLNMLSADERRCLSPHVLLDFGRRGIMGLQDAPENGGCGLSLANSLRVLRQLAAIDLSLANIVAMHNFLAGTVLRRHASEKIKREFTADLASGRLLAAFALTECAAGSDPRRIKSLAIRQKDGGWILNGEKIWSGLAAWSGLIVTFAQAQDTSGKNLGITAFAVRTDAPGVRLGPDCYSMGLRSVVQNEIYFEKVKIEDEYRLGKTGRGLETGQEAMMLCRLVMGVLSLGAMERVLQIAARFVPQRSISTGMMMENPVVLRKLAQETARLEAIELYINYILRLLDHKDSFLIHDELFLVSKIIAPENMWQTIDAAMQMLGGRGYLENNVIARFMRDGRVLRIFEGPTETLVAHLGALIWLRHEVFEKVLCDELNCEEIWQVLIKFKTDCIDSVKFGTRESLKINQFSLGVLSAHALFYAVVKFECENDNASAGVRLAKDMFFSQLNQVASPSFSTIDPKILFGNLHKISVRVGEVDERNIQPNGSIDPLLSDLRVNAEVNL